jgi:hypothetical protein
MRGAFVGILFALGAGSSDDGATGGDSGEDATISAFDAAEASPPAPVDAGPLWQPCTPSNPASCPSGLTCLAAHTFPTDAYGRCVFACSGDNGPACALDDGTCACPLTGGAGSAPADCSPGNDAGSVTVCIPAGDASVSGTNQLPDSGPPPVTDSGPVDAPPG